MQYVDKNNLFEIQIDVTSYCNSYCGACVRNIKGGPVNPNVILEHIDWNVWKDICTFCGENNVKLMTFNGNFGDISSHPNYIEMLEYLYKKTKKIKLNIHTNGGARSEKFWKDLAGCVKKFPSSIVTFSIDGLEDTNHIYRRGTDFSKIIHNMTAYIKSGGLARWRMIVFDHNKHQIQQASDLAKKLGCYAFSLNRSFDTNIEVMQYRTFDAGYITSPNHDEVKVLSAKFDWELKLDQEMSQYKGLEKNDTLCPWQQDKKIQINQIGEVWPCCYYSMHTGRPNDRRRFIWFDEQLKQYQEHFNNIKFYKLSQILEHEFFTKDLQYSFKNSKMGLCKEKCGV